MKTIILIALLAMPCVVSAQTTTNLQWKVTVETVVAGVTNSSNATLRFDYGNKKDALSVDGLAKAFGNTPGAADFPAWLKQDVKDRAKAYSDVKLAADNAVLLAKLTTLLQSNPDLLTSGDLSSLATIAAKAP